VEGLVSVPPAKYVAAPIPNTPDYLIILNICFLLLLWVPTPNSNTFEILDAASNSRAELAARFLPICSVVFQLEGTLFDL
jgi:hypothetical protein